MSRIYLDHNSSTRIDPRVLEALIQELRHEEGNPSSIHFHGKEARRTLEESRAIIARFFKVKPREVIFTSGGTEGAALLLQGIFFRNPTGHAISSGTEHSCVYQTLKEIGGRGLEVSFLSPGEWGAVLPSDVQKAIRPQTRLIALMAVNNETGVMTDLPAIAAIARRENIPLIVDGVAWLGKEKIEIPLGVSALFFSGHKIHAPKGVGFCICPQNLKLSPLLIGGGQEFNRRAGTENISGIAALAKAISLFENEQEGAIDHMRRMRDLLEEELLCHLNGVAVNGKGPRICNTSNLAFHGVDGETLLIDLDLQGISASLGSACASGALEPSRALLEMGIPLSQVKSSVRFSVGKTTTEDEIRSAIAIIIQTVKRLRSFS